MIEKLKMFGTLIFELPSAIFFIIYLMFSFFYDLFNKRIHYDGDLSDEERAMKEITNNFMESKKHLFDKYRKHINSIFWIIVALLILF
jgi:hypothetical protein